MKRSMVLVACLLAACAVEESTFVVGTEDSAEVVEDEAEERPPGEERPASPGMCSLYGDASLEVSFDDQKMSIEVPTLCDAYYVERGRPPESPETTTFELLGLPEEAKMPMEQE